MADTVREYWLCQYVWRKKRGKKVKEKKIMKDMTGYDIPERFEWYYIWLMYVQNRQEWTNRSDSRHWNIQYVYTTINMTYTALVRAYYTCCRTDYNTRVHRCRKVYHSLAPDALGNSCRWLSSQLKWNRLRSPYNARFPLLGNQFFLYTLDGHLPRILLADRSRDLWTDI